MLSVKGEGFLYLSNPVHSMKGVLGRSASGHKSEGHLLSNFMVYTTSQSFAGLVFGRFLNVNDLSFGIYFLRTNLMPIEEVSSLNVNYCVFPWNLYFITIKHSKVSTVTHLGV